MKTKKWHLSGRESASLKWRHIRRNIEGHNIEDKIHCTASKLAKTWLKSSLAIYHNVIYETRRYKIWLKSMAEINGVSEIKYFIFIEINDYPYENYNNYIKLSIVFHPMIIFLGNKDI
jgi:hypothetical protein